MIAAVESGLQVKGFVKANHPDVLVNIVIVDKELAKSSSGWLGGEILDYQKWSFLGTLDYVSLWIGIKSLYLADKKAKNTYEI